MNQKNWGVWTLSSQTHTQLPEGRRREVVGATLTIRLQRPFAIIRDFPKKSHVNAATLLKISETSNAIYDIIKHALAILVGSAAVRESCTLAEPPIGFLRMPKGSIAKKKINYNNFFILPQFLCEFKSLSGKF